MKKKILGTLLVSSLAVMGSIAYASDIIHDAEYEILEAQNGERWAVEDKEIEKKTGCTQKEARQETQYYSYHVG